MWKRLSKLRPFCRTSNMICGAMTQAHVEVVTGGSPRVFNPAAAAWYDSNIQNVYRIVNNKDIVPSLPPSTVGYVLTY